MKFRLLSAAAAAAIGAASAAPADPDAGPAPGQGGSDAAKDDDDKPADQPKTTDTPSDGGSQAADTPVDVVAASDVAGLTAAAEKKGFAAANARMKAVFDSPEGKSNAHTAAFLLATSDASADDIIGHLKGQAPAAAPAASADAPKIPDTKTNIVTDPAALAADQGAQAEIADSWDAALARRAAAHAPIVPAAHAAAAAGAHTITAAIPRTGN